MKKKLKILLINNAYPTAHYPKKGGYIKSIEECLKEADFFVDKLVLKNTKGNKTPKIISYVRFYLDLFFFQKYSRYDYIFIHHFPYVFFPLIFSFWKMKQVVVNFHGEDIVFTSSFSKALNNLSYMFLSTRFKYIFPSNYFKDKASSVIHKLNFSEKFVSPSGGVDTSIFKPLNEKPNISNIINIGFASGMVHNKGVEDLISLLSDFNASSCCFHIIDYGKQRDKYVSSIKAFKNVILYKTFKKEDMPNFYSKIDVLFFPTKSESLGLVALEAMSCNVPVIGPDAFALKEIIVDGVTGEKYNPLENKAYMKAFDTFKENRNKYRPFSFIKEFYSKEQVVNHLKLIFN
jgi:glycosyltransferase involved in cell wall biosynthesis